jgi:hypothetical protein
MASRQPCPPENIQSKFLKPLAIAHQSNQRQRRAIIPAQAIGLGYDSSTIIKG